MIPSFPFVPAKERQMRGSPPGPAWHPAAWLGTAVLLALVSVGGGAVAVEVRRWGSPPGRPVPSTQPQPGRDVMRALLRGRSFIQPCGTSLISWPCLSPLGLGTQRDTRGSSLTAGFRWDPASLRPRQSFGLGKGQCWSG